MSITFPDGREYLGEFKDGKEWNGTQYDKDANENSKYVNGKIEKNDEPLTLINVKSKGHFSLTITLIIHKSDTPQIKYPNSCKKNDLFYIFANKLQSQSILFTTNLSKISGG